MAKTAADVLVESLIDWNVEVVFGLPGDGINGPACKVGNVFNVGCDLLPVDFAAFARACGGGLTIDDPARGGETLDQALATAGPVIVEAVVDPLAPPMPAKVTVEQAAKFAESLARGEPNRPKIAWTVLSDKVRELV